MRSGYSFSDERLRGRLGFSDLGCSSLLYISISKIVISLISLGCTFCITSGSFSLLSFRLPTKA